MRGRPLVALQQVVEVPRAVHYTVNFYCGHPRTSLNTRGHCVMAAHKVSSEPRTITARLNMQIIRNSSEFNFAVKVRRILLVLVGIAFLLLKRHYAGPLDGIVHAYLGNLSVSFSVYFLFANLEFPLRIRGLLAAAITFAVVELFEAFDGFGVMSNTYDPIDFLANGCGIALALWLDTKLTAERTDIRNATPSSSSKD